MIRLLNYWAGQVRAILAAAGAKRILIVDDEEAIAQVLTLKLKHAGFEVSAAANGEAALKILEGEKFDLILLDLIMPKVDGFGVLTELKARGDKTPVIVASTLIQEEDVKRAKELGAVDYYTKSDVSLEEMVQRIQKVVGSASA